MIDADKSIVSWENYAYCSDIFDRLDGCLPMDPKTRAWALEEFEYVQDEGGLSMAVSACNGPLPYELYLEFELNRKEMESFYPKFEQEYEEILEKYGVQPPQVGAAPMEA